MNHKTTSNWRFVFHAIQNEINLWSKAIVALESKRILRSFTSNMTIEQTLLLHPASYIVLQKFGFPNCKNCSVRFDETLQEASEAYDINLNQMLSSLNQLLQKNDVSRI